MGSLLNKTCKENDGSAFKEGTSKKIEECANTEDNREDYHNNVDILFVLDTTSSMGSYIAPAMKTIEKIVESFSKMEYDIRFSICTYRDHPPQDSSYVFQFQNLMTDKQMIQYLSKVFCAGGGDGPEAVMDGLREGLSQTSWRVGEDQKTPSKRFLFHICDAPPHGKEYSNDSSDPEWRKNGCPCGTNKDHIRDLLKTHNVHYNLIKAVDGVNKMEKVFKKSFGTYFAETIKLDPLPANMVNTYYDRGAYMDCERADYGAAYACDEGENDIHVNNLCDEVKSPALAKSSISVAKVMQCEDVSAHTKNMEALESCNLKNNMWDGVVKAIHKKL